MVYIKKKRGFEIPEREATPEEAYMMTRRGFVKSMGLLSVFLITGCDDFVSPPSSGMGKAPKPPEKTPSSGLYPAARNEKYLLDRPLTEELVAAKYNNFYEFSTKKSRIWRLVERFETRPWEVEVTGLVEKPGVYDVDELSKMMGLEERLYRLRCVEAWSMAVPWTGFPMRDFIKKVKPLSSAKYVKMVTFLNKEVAPGQRKIWLPWPYTEGLTMAEATNELTLLATGIYGHELPGQHGAPIRLIVPWKYGFKSIKSIVSIEFTDRMPRTFWNTVAPDEYDFWANVDPEVPHPRWSQATERVIGTNERRPTIKYNGYSRFVAGLYED
jgi:sulfoxide reductase catalytic subunit YedY